MVAVGAPLPPTHPTLCLIVTYPPFPLCPFPSCFYSCSPPFLFPFILLPLDHFPPVPTYSPSPSAFRFMLHLFPPLFAPSFLFLLIHPHLTAPSFLFLLIHPHLFAPSFLFLLIHPHLFVPYFLFPLIHPHLSAPSFLFPLIHPPLSAPSLLLPLLSLPVITYSLLTSVLLTSHYHLFFPFSVPPFLL